MTRQLLLKDHLTRKRTKTGMLVDRLRHFVDHKIHTLKLSAVYFIVRHERKQCSALLVTRLPRPVIVKHVAYLIVGITLKPFVVEIYSLQKLFFVKKPLHVAPLNQNERPVTSIVTRRCAYKNYTTKFARCQAFSIEISTLTQPFPTAAKRE